ncbi:MAG: adenosylmethionine decarboxylase [Aeropyrum sp.]|nr:adenosylmethionine decarboxylase [Aeropyrum sp.]MCE4615927.1 adenosylmethionine decarboxylase [Aeropyrum sp.]
MEERVVGKHVYGSLYSIDKSKAWDEDYLKSLMVRAAEASGATVHAVNSWTIPGEKGGVSVIVLVLESHLALHTWPYYDYATFDIYTCGAHTDPWKAFELLISELKPSRYRVHYSDRSQEILPPPSSSVAERST